MRDYCVRIANITESRLSHQVPFELSHHSFHINKLWVPEFIKPLKQMLSQRAHGVGCPREGRKEFSRTLSIYTCVQSAGY